MTTFKTTTVSVLTPKEIFSKLREKNLTPYIKRFEQIMSDGTKSFYYKVKLKIEYRPIVTIYLYNKSNQYKFNSFINQSEKMLKYYIELANILRNFYNMEPLSEI